MKIAIYGLGYVGLTAAACIAKEGHQVLGVDVSPEKVAKTNAGISHIEEPGITELLSEAVAEGRLHCVAEVKAELDSIDLAIVCVGTPSGPDGAHNMRFIADVSRQIAQRIKADRAVPLTVAYRSTIRPGTIEGLIRPIFDAVLGPASDRVELVYNPEFLREAVAVQDYFNPPKIVVGTHDGQPNARMDALHANLNAPVFYTGYREAEFTKFVDNSFHALKVAFANEIGRLCVQMDISARTVHKVFISDTKLNISPYYLRPGGPFGGSCLPKDVRALQHIAADVGAHTHLVDSLIRSNEAHKHFLFEYCTRGIEPGSRILMVGLAFKSDSDDLRESPKIDLARKLLAAGYHLDVYDPNLRPAHLVGQNLGYAFAYLPTLPELLVASDAAEAAHYALVIDTNGSAKNLNLKADRLVDVNTLD